jgi:ribosome maturation factor RimP
MLEDSSKIEGELSKVDDEKSHLFYVTENRKISKRKSRCGGEEISYPEIKKALVVIKF